MKTKILLTIAFLIFSLVSISQNLTKFKSEEGKVGLKDENEKIVLNPIYDYIYNFNSGFAKIFIGDTLDYGDPKQGVFGLVNKRGKVIVEPKYNHIYNFNKTWARVFIGKTYDGCNPIEGKYGFIDKSGKEVIPPNYKRAKNFYLGICKVNFNGKVGYIDSTENAIIPFEYDHITNFRKGLATTFVGTTDDRGNTIEGKYGVIDISGKELIPAIYDRASYTDGFAFVVNNNKFGLLKGGDTIINFIYDGAKGYANGLILIYNNVDKNTDEINPIYDDYGNEIIERKYGFVDTLGNLVIPMIYDDAIDLRNKLSIVKKNGYYGIINRAGETILDFSYDKIYIPEEGNGEYQMRTLKDGKYGCIEPDGKVILEPNYDRINLSYYDSGIIVVTNDEKMGCVNIKGELVIPLDFDYISVYNKNKFRVTIDEKTYFVNSKGEKIE
ncbi:MAG: hypothetical protein DRI86_00810 [Bacteroidetes bacterium]|nr:MAG: hypothetical protein DRI86_00810 [Bacteroidota bacterium]